MGAPTPELCNLWLARAFNAQDAEAAASMYHPDGVLVQSDEANGGTSVSRGVDGVHKMIAAFAGLKPHIDVVTHHTTVAGDVALT
ncbi:MAG: nuclear transport factor 2 family protein, partial [Solimonas sp.]